MPHYTKDPKRDPNIDNHPSKRLNFPVDTELLEPKKCKGWVLGTKLNIPRAYQKASLVRPGHLVRVFKRLSGVRSQRVLSTHVGVTCPDKP